AEDGIRDRNVTGVQTCALPISLGGTGGRYSEDVDVGANRPPVVGYHHGRLFSVLWDRPQLGLEALTVRLVHQDPVRSSRPTGLRSEERRVGKEWRSGVVR